jgi:hypothetical protein
MKRLRIGIRRGYYEGGINVMNFLCFFTYVAMAELYV